jgi:hypothetical protein
MTQHSEFTILIEMQYLIDVMQWFPKCGVRPPGGGGARGAKLFYSLQYVKNTSIIRKIKVLLDGLLSKIRLCSIYYILCFFPGGRKLKQNLEGGRKV